jgi:hypothetical protein
MADNNLVQNGDFSADPSDIDPWWLSPDDPSAIKATPLGGGRLKVNVIKPGKESSDAILGQGEIRIEAGTRYLLSFRAQADRPTRIQANVQTSQEPYKNYFAQGINLTTSREEFAFEFSVLVSDPTATLQFELGGNDEVTFTFGAVALTARGQVGTGEEDRFYLHEVEPYAYLNDVWGQGYLNVEKGEDFRQWLKRRKSEGREIWGWEWSGPGRQEDRVYSFPEILYGAKPFDDTKKTSAPLPLELARISSIELTYDVTLSTGNGSYNLSPEFYVTDRALHLSSRNIVAEIMIWLDASGDAQPAGKVIASVEIGGRAYELWEDDMEEPGSTQPHPPKWKYLAYVVNPASRQGGRLGGKLPIHEFLRDATTRGFVKTGQFLASVEFGIEIRRGLGSLWVNDYRVDLA